MLYIYTHICIYLYIYIHTYTYMYMYTTNHGCDSNLFDWHRFRALLPKLPGLFWTVARLAYNRPVCKVSGQSSELPCSLYLYIEENQL